MTLPPFPEALARKRNPAPCAECSRPSVITFIDASGARKLCAECYSRIPLPEAD